MSTDETRIYGAESWLIRQSFCGVHHTEALCIAQVSDVEYTSNMRTLTVRLPEALAANIEAESRERRISKSDVVRERLERAANGQNGAPASVEAIAELIGSVDGLPADLSGQKKKYLKTTGYGQKRAR